MEIASRPLEKESTSPTSSKNSSGGNSYNNGTQIQTPPVTPKPISRSEPNPFPTTFVQADSSSFKQVVQMLTGSSVKTARQASKPISDPPSSKGNIPPIKTGQKKQGFKLYERRNSIKNGLMINPSMPKFANGAGFSPRLPELLSPSILDFPALALSPVTPLNDNPFDKNSTSLEEDRAISEKRFYLHPSPMSTPAGSGPQLLPLFPLTSPRVSGSSS